MKKEKYLKSNPKMKQQEEKERKEKDLLKKYIKVMMEK